MASGELGHSSRSYAGSGELLSSGKASDASIIMSGSLSSTSSMDTSTKSSLSSCVTVSHISKGSTTGKMSVENTQFEFKRKSTEDQKVMRKWDSFGEMQRSSPSRASMELGEVSDSGESVHSNCLPLGIEGSKLLLCYEDHPFLPSLYTHFETDKFTCLVMEFCPGGDLHTARQRQPGKYFQEMAARFYAAEVLLALEYLHMMGVIYRDLKPENVLVRQDGHIMLSDFDLSLRCVVRPTLVKSASAVEADPSRRVLAYCVQPACEPACITPACIAPTCMAPSCLLPKLLPSLSIGRLRKQKIEPAYQVTALPELLAEPTGARSMSFVGTHEYLAPEIIKGEGHGSAVDWWTYGIFLYELLHGRTPFKGAGNRATLFNVVGHPLRFPEAPVVSYAARDLISGLLVKDPQHRLGYKRGATEIKQHPFFEGVNWALIRSMAPPEIPRTFELNFASATGTSTTPSSSATGSSKGLPGEGENRNSGSYLDFDFF
ncbi:hypothetical protein GOP47_0016621 [Adiantum capillus-veneris]|uniref:non-specific serine/threonine protein kinase n=1 Tax=Adiantum capillus-veneris TaxID=13818 RepID=A0A9D4ZD57_ADICA|nr:hypothetical protein GOP47_0016621 [Adiantum capillus-veneris]